MSKYKMLKASYNEFERVFKSVILTSNFYILNSLNQRENINNH
jgi:hypothetical protein